MYEFEYVLKMLDLGEIFDKNVHYQIYPSVWGSRNVLIVYTSKVVEQVKYKLWPQLLLIKLYTNLTILSEIVKVWLICEKRWTLGQTFAWC